MPSVWKMRTFLWHFYYTAQDEQKFKIEEIKTFAKMRIQESMGDISGVTSTCCYRGTNLKSFSVEETDLDKPSRYADHTALKISFCQNTTSKEKHVKIKYLSLESS